MKAFRYNTIRREDRKFNNCGFEKNPNSVKFYASNMEYAERYKFVNGYECTLEVVEIKENLKLFDMPKSFKSLNTYKNYISSTIQKMKSDCITFLNDATTAKAKKMWLKNIENLKNEETELISALKREEFQTLSDFELQNELIAELKLLGFDGYFTKNEIAIF